MLARTSVTPKTSAASLRCGLTSGRNYSRIIDVGKVTTYKISNLIPGRTYYCVVTAYDAAGKESPPSNEISFTVSPLAQPSLFDGNFGNFSAFATREAA